MIIGIDPGLDGAIAVLYEGSLNTIDMPTFTIKKNGQNRRIVDVNSLAHIIKDVKTEETKAIVEKVWSRPGNGAAASFSFGHNYGVIIGVLAANQIPMTLVPPAQWKRDMHVLKGKDAARMRASEIFPQYGALWRRKKDDGRAEAALLAYYGASLITV